MSVSAHLKASYNEMKPVQKIIADFFLAADFDSLNASIDDVARRTGTSVASISRFCKALGFDGFSQFKITLSRDLKYEPDTVLPIFKMGDDPNLIIRKVFSEAVSNLQATEEAVDFDTVKLVARRIVQYRAVLFFGLGGSGKVGAIGEMLFSHIGYAARAVIDPYEMFVTAGHADKNCTIIALSHSGYTWHVVEAIAIARKRKVFTVGITNYRGSLLAENVDALLLTACPERRVHIAQSNSMVAQSTLLRSLYLLAASRADGKLQDVVNRINDSVEGKLRVHKKHR